VPNRLLNSGVEPLYDEASYIPHVVDVAMAEAAALRDGILLAQQIGCSRVEFQSDCWKSSQQCKREVSRPRQQGWYMMNASNIGRILMLYLLVIVSGSVTLLLMS
jgi:hypothetical protein